MKEEVFKIDANGFVIEKFHALFDDSGNCLDNFKDDVVAQPLPQGLYRAKWTGAEWVEDMSQEEIYEINKPQPREPTEIEQLKISQAEQFETILEILGGMM